MNVSKWLFAIARIKHMWVSVKVSVIVLVIVTSKAVPIHPVYAAEERSAAR